MATTIIIHDDRVEVLRDGYNIIEKTIYEPELVGLAHTLVSELENEQ